MLAENLKIARKSMGWTQEELADKSGISKPIIGRYETGASFPSPKSLRKLADTLKIPIKQLLENKSVLEASKDSKSLKEEPFNEKEFLKKLKSVKKFNSTEKKVIEGMIDIILNNKIQSKSSVKLAKVLVEMHNESVA
jgi:transcriptional regulator with XRE-family HTH domain